ncbi:serine/threonine-protein kinase [Kitasatospora sp. NPDC089797]|uniref:serine/threonine-protein kinase n=1 Tax=Kitasatospora sp. NPDC089797 TaxID=3155298 RepID=UPI00343BD4B8
MRALGSDDPRRVGGYRLLRRLGSGGMGRVYLGRTAGGRTVAVKVVRTELADDAEFRARFRHEVAAARRVGGNWTAPVLDADTEGEAPWVATGYVAGPALSAAVRAHGPLPEPAVRALGVGLTGALAHVHGLGLVHRDVKPSNVLLTLDGPRLIDFGIARALDATSGFTRSGYVVGSPGFMSPEQANGQTAGPAGDVFSLGAVLAYAATGVHPFGEGVSAAVLLYRVLHEEPDVAGLPEPLRATVLHCLAKDPAARPTPQQLAARLDPDGAAADRLTRGDWLPPVLAAGVGRSAVELLDLELLEREGEPFGAVPRTEAPAEVSWTGTVRDAGARGGAGAPTRPAGEDVAAPAGPTGERGGSGDRDRDEGGSGAGAGAEGWSGDGVLSAPGPGEEPGSARRRRRAGAAAALLLGVAVLGGGGYGLYALTHRPGPVASAPSAGPVPPPSTGPGAPAVSPVTSAVPPVASAAATAGSGAGSGAASGAAAAPPVTGGPDAVPAAFLGTWTGDMVTDKGLPGGTTTLTVRQAAVGQDAVASRNAVSGLISISCEGAWTLTSASGTTLVFRSRLVRSSLPGACTSGSNAETLTLESDGTIRFSSADPAAGNPVGTLRKAGAAAP